MMKSSLFQGYSKLLTKYPLTTKCTTSGLIAGCGDLISQSMLSSNKENGGMDINWTRFLTFTTLGTFYVAPVLHLWYGYLGKTIIGATPRAVFSRVFADQLIFAPLFVPSFFTMLSLLQGNVQELPQQLQNEWWKTVQVNWTLWIPAQMVNFRFVPLQYQVLFSNGVGLIWNIYLSHVSFRKMENEIEVKENM